MSLVTCTGSGATLEVYSATIVRPFAGVWHATLDVDSGVELSGQVTIGVADGALSLVGVAKGAIVAERQRVRVVGGAGGLAVRVAAKQYGKVPLRVPLSDILSAAGERLATSSDAEALATVLARWTRMEGRASHALDELVARAPGAVWRMTASGAVFVGVNRWPAVTLDYVLVEDDPVARRMVIASDDPTLTAGVTLDGRRIEHVVHRFEPTGTRSEVLYS